MNSLSSEAQKAASNRADRTHFMEGSKVKTKLDRLLELIANGKTFAMKQAAAKQLGFLQTEFSYDLSFLLHRLYPLFLHPDFDCRRGAALALDELKPHSRPQFHRWVTKRALLSLADFDVRPLIASKVRLAHVATEHTVAAKDYSLQVFDVENDQGVAEMCQLSEQMVLKLDSENWHYRHGAVLCLLRTVESTAPSGYIEDLAVRLFILLVKDRFQDMIGDMTRLPVQEPACHLLARCLMQNLDQGLRILEQFHCVKTPEDWVMKLSFWLVVKYMLAIDKECFDVAWLHKMLMETLDDEHDDVVAAAIEAVLPVIGRLPNADDVGMSIWNLLNRDSLDCGLGDEADLAPFNASVMEAVEKMWRETAFRKFMDDDAIETILQVVRYPISATRTATYRLLRTVMDDGGDEFDNCVMDFDDFGQFSLKIIDTLIKEASNEIFHDNLDLIVSLGNVAARVGSQSGWILNEKYCQQICDKAGGDDKSKIQNLPKIMKILEQLAKIVKLPNKITFGEFSTRWGRVMAVIVCLHAGVSEPDFAGQQKSIFKKPPLNVIISLFSLDLTSVPSKLNEMADLHSSLVFFVITVVGRQLKAQRRNDVINELIARCSADVKDRISRVNTETSYSVLRSQERPDMLTAVVMELVSNSVFDEPENLATVENITKLLCLVRSKAVLSNVTVRLMIDALQHSSYNISSCIAYIADMYANTHPESFLSEFVWFMTSEQLELGALEFIDLFLTNFGETKLDLLPWASFFVPPCLANRANQDEQKRRLASHSLAQIVRLLPLDNGDFTRLPETLHEKKKESMSYLAPLFDLAKAEPVTLNPAPDFSQCIKMEDGSPAQIRDYQVDGINWLGFLHKYGLNGILADDMGLGKTFQCLCIIANVHQTYKNPLSLIVCPSPVAIHWKNEALAFFPGHWQVYLGLTKGDLASFDIRTATGILVISYGVMCSDIDELLKRKFCYCVLDEGHLIKNKKSKKGEVAMRIRSDHRLILSGTPIQNNVTELWSLMDFLMPGFLGSQKVFNLRYNNKIQKMFRPNASEEETRSGQAALDELHKQVLPFILRRLKNDVLAQLPEKVIYDEVFHMTPEQERLYKQTDSQTGINLSAVSEIDENNFTRMRAQRKICVHPCLVDPTIPCELRYSAKLVHLKKLLLTRLGFEGGDDTMRNRALIFAQETKTLDLVKQLVLDPNNITNDRIDGRITETERNETIEQFKREDGCDVLLLTTKIGGLGLNLPVANIVIFVENSWNPAEDDQAMDRAHRLGQRRQVTVFNLITDETIEVKIMQTQKNKRFMFKRIINDDNKSINTVDELTDVQEPEKPKSENRKLTQAEIAKHAEETMYDQDQYNFHADGDSEWTRRKNNDSM